jgi:hypothetical protein
MSLLELFCDVDYPQPTANLDLSKFFLVPC